MSNDMTQAAVERLTSQISEAVFGEPGTDLLELANRCNALRAGQRPFPIVELLDVRNQLHVMATTMLPNFCDVAARLQGQVQALIDNYRRENQDPLP